MKPVAAGKLESASEKRARVLKARQEEKLRKEQEEREAQARKEQEEREAQARKDQQEWEDRQQRRREEEEAAEHARREEQERRRAEEEAREKEAEQQALAAEQERRNEMEASLAEAGLPEGWKNQKGVVKVDEMLRLKCPLIVFLREDEARRYMTWLQADEESARQYARERVEQDTAFILPKGGKVVVTLCEEDEEEGDIPARALFHVSAVDGTEGWASNLILRHHRVAKKKAPKKK